MEHIDVSKLRIRIPPDNYGQDLSTPKKKGKAASSSSSFAHKPKLAEIHDGVVSTPVPPFAVPLPLPGRDIYDTIARAAMPADAPILSDEADVNEVYYEAGNRASFEVVFKGYLTAPPLPARSSHQPRGTHPVPRIPVSARPPRHPPAPQPPAPQPLTLPPLLNYIDTAVSNYYSLPLESEICEYLTTILRLMCEFGVELSGDLEDPYTLTTLYPIELSIRQFNKALQRDVQRAIDTAIYYSHLREEGCDIGLYTFHSLFSADTMGIVISNVSNVQDMCYFKYEELKAVSIQEVCELIYRAFRVEPANKNISVVSISKQQGIIFIKAIYEW